MAEIFQTDRNSRIEAGVAATYQPRAFKVLQDQAVLDAMHPEAYETAASYWRNQSILGSLASYGLPVEGNPQDHQEGFNPYSFYSKNKDEFTRLEPFLRKGYFDHAYNEGEFRLRAHRVNQELDDLSSIENGSGFGKLLGMGLSLLDITTLIPFAGATKLRPIASAMRLAGAGAAQQTGQELMLHSMQAARTQEESFLNIGISGALGGGIGVFASSMHPASPLNPKHPNNPLKIDLDNPAPTGVWQPGVSMSESEIVGGKSVGAAAVGNPELSQLARADEGIGRVIQKGVDLVARPFRNVNPLSTILNARLSSAREAGLKLADSGGAITKHNLAGGATEASAEDLALDFVHRGFVAEYQATRDGVFGANTALGAKFDGGKSLDTGEFTAFVQKALTSVEHQTSGALHPLDEKFIKDALAAKGYDADEALKVVKPYIDEAVSVLHKNNEWVEKEGVMSGLFDPEKVLGKNYGMAQLYNNATIRDNPELARQFFLDVFSGQPAPHWLDETYGMKADDFLKLPIGDPKRAEIMDAWVGDSFRLQLEKQDAALAVHERAYKDALEVLNVVNHAVKLTAEDVAGKSLAAHTARVRKHEAELALARLENLGERVEAATYRADHLRQELEQAQEALSSQRAERNVIAQGVKAAGEDAADAISSATRFEAAVEKLGAKMDERASGKMRKSVDEGTQRDVKFEELQARYEQALEEALTARRAFQSETAILKDASKGLKISEREITDTLEHIQKNREKFAAADAVAQIEERTRVIERAAERLNTVKETLAKASEARLEAARVYKTMREGAKNSKIDVAAARRELRKAARAAKKHAGDTVGKVEAEVKGNKPVDVRETVRRSITDYIDELVTALSKTENLPRGVMEHQLFQTGRSKERRIHYTTEQRRRAEELGILKADLFENRLRAYQDIGARVALRKTFGEEDMKSTLSTIRREYDTAAQQATGRERARIIDERDKSLEALEAMRQRLLGTYGMPDGLENLATWGIGKLRQLTYLRFAAGFPISSWTDIATTKFSTGYGHSIAASGKKFYDILQTAKVDRNSRELRNLLTAMEFMGAHARTAKMAGVEDLAYQRGIGSKGTLTNDVTGAVDKVTGYLQDRMNPWSGMQAWNTTVKGAAALIQMDNIRRMVGKYDQLSTLDRTKLAVLGIDAARAKEIDSLMRVFGKEEGGVFDPRAYLWENTKGGDEVHRVLRVAIRRTMDRAVMSPGIGDTPLMMSKPLGNLMFQFASFGFKTVNTFHRPALQRALVLGDTQVAFTVAHILSIGALITAVKGYMGGRDVSQYSTRQWISDSIDRSGLYAFMSPYMDAASKAIGPGINSLTGTELLPPSTRFQQNNWLESLLGPWWSTARTGQQALSAANDGDWPKVAEKALMLAPFNQLPRMAFAWDAASGE
jgi:hypothetical protein